MICGSNNTLSISFDLLFILFINISAKRSPTLYIGCLTVVSGTTSFASPSKPTTDISLGITIFFSFKAL